MFKFISTFQLQLQDSEAGSNWPALEPPLANLTFTVWLAFASDVLLLFVIIFSGNRSGSAGKLLNSGSLPAFFTKPQSSPLQSITVTVWPALQIPFTFSRSASCQASVKGSSGVSFALYTGHRTTHAPTSPSNSIRPFLVGRSVSDPVSEILRYSTY